MFTTIAHLWRLGRVGFVLAREGAFGLVDPALAPLAARPLISVARLIERRGLKGSGEGLTRALERLGPSYVKLGQFLATRADIVGPRIAGDLAKLQDRMAPFDQAVAEHAVAEALGQPLSAAFRSFGPAIAAASVAQVHRCLTADGREVAVKVLRPGIHARFARDLSDMAFAARLAERHSAEARRLRMIESAATLARSVTLELDLRIEAAALSELAENMAEDKDFRVPAPDWSLTARNVLTTQWVDGIPLTNLDAITAAGHDRPALAKIVVQSFLKQAIGTGLFHADMHPGNLFVDPQGRLVAVDAGITGRIGMKERRFLAEILFGFITRDYRRIAAVHFEAGYVPSHHSVDEFAQALRAVGEPIHDRSAADISMAKLLTLLFEITAIFDMQTRTELIMLQRTMVVVEGVARQLDPAFDMWRTAEPVIRDWIARHLGPIGRIEEAGRGLASLASALSQLPETVARGERLLETIETRSGQGVRLDAASVEAIGKAEGRGNRGLTLGIWALVALAIAALWH